MTKENEVSLSQFRIGNPQAFDGLTVFPILGIEDVLLPEYISMREAMERGYLEIEEVNEDGSVPTLKANNKGPVPILLLDGEEVQGAKQNRIMNTSILLKPSSVTNIPVSCTEQGRWNYRTTKFSESEYMMASRARMKKSMSVKASVKRAMAVKNGMVEAMDYKADQGEVWDEVRELHKELRTHSQTGAMRDAYLQKRKDVEKARAEFDLLPGQSGMMVFENGRFKSLDLISRPEVFQHQFDKLLQSHLIEWKRDQDTNREPSIQDAEALLDEINSMKEEMRKPSVSLGEEVRCTDDKLEASRLEYEGGLVHLYAFEKTRIAGKSQRGRWMNPFDFRNTPRDEDNDINPVDDEIWF